MSTNGLYKLPFGNLPRLLLAWVCTEAVRTRSRVLILGDSLAKFMRELGVYSSGGGNAGIKLRNQMKRLFDCTVQLTYKDENGEVAVNSLIARRTESGGMSASPISLHCGRAKSNSAKTCSTKSSAPVPFDMNTLTALKRCALGLDLYLWLVYRTFSLRAPQRITCGRYTVSSAYTRTRVSDKKTS